MDSSELEAARAAAFRFIGYAARSSFEVELKLTRSGFSADAMKQVLADLKQAGLIDDGKFASAWIDDRADRMRYGKKRLAAELTRRGIDGDTIKEVIGSISEEDEVRRAAELVYRKWPLTRSDISKDETERLSTYLRRRGFNWPTVKQVLAMREENRKKLL